VTSTPQIYILDENKQIVAKKIGPEQVEEIISLMIKNKSGSSTVHGKGG